MQEISTQYAVLTMRLTGSIVIWPMPGTNAETGDQCAVDGQGCAAPRGLHFNLPSADSVVLLIKTYE